MTSSACDRRQILNEVISYFAQQRIWYFYGNFIIEALKRDLIPKFDARLGEWLKILADAEKWLDYSLCIIEAMKAGVIDKSDARLTQALSALELENRADDYTYLITEAMKANVMDKSDPRLKMGLNALERESQWYHFRMRTVEALKADLIKKSKEHVEECFKVLAKEGQWEDYISLMIYAINENLVEKTEGCLTEAFSVWTKAQGVINLSFIIQAMKKGLVEKSDTRLDQGLKDLSQAGEWSYYTKFIIEAMKADVIEKLDPRLDEGLKALAEAGQIEVYTLLITVAMREGILDFDSDYFRFILENKQQRPLVNEPVKQKLTFIKSGDNVMHFTERAYMNLKNRWEDDANKDAGLLGPDGQPLSATPPSTADDTSKAPEEPQLDFFNYIASLGFQTMIFLGEMPNPITNQIDKNLKQAKFLIDTLIILRDKTKGNLSKEEDDLLNGSIYELQMRFVELSK